MDITQEKLDRIAKLRDQLTQWEQGFTESVFDQYKRRGRLSSSQVDVIDKILRQHNPDAIKARDDWRANYDDEKREIARKVAEYYHKNPPYYTAVAEKILTDPAYIPSEKCYRKMTENKYAQRALAVGATPPSFSKGQLVRFRRNSEVRDFHSAWINAKRTDLAGKLAVVLSISDTPGAAKGSRGYTVLPMGGALPINTLERRLMQSKTA